MPSFHQKSATDACHLEQINLKELAPQVTGKHDDPETQRLVVRVPQLRPGNELSQRELRIPPARTAPEAQKVTSNPDESLGLTRAEIEILRAASSQSSCPSLTSSRTSSRASSLGLLMLDQSALLALGRHFDKTMQQVQQKLKHLVEQTSISTMHTYDRAGSLIDNADTEIARYHDIMAQIDQLELEFDRISHIRDIVKDFRHRAEQLEAELNMTPATSSSQPSAVLAPHNTRDDNKAAPHCLTELGSNESSKKVDELSNILHSTDFFQDTSDVLRPDREENPGTAGISRANEPLLAENKSLSILSHDTLGYDESDVSEEERERSSEEFDSSSPSSDRSWTSIQKENAINRAMAQFVRWLDSRLLVYNQHGGQGSAVSSQGVGSVSQSGHGSSHVQRSSASRGSKRPPQGLGPGGFEGSDGEEDGDGSEPQPKKAKVEDLLPRKLACPFFKRDPRKYHLWRACPGPGWDTVHRVKEHLYRRHSLPKFKCYRCRRHFQDESRLSEHAMAEQRCEPCEEVGIQDGLSEKQVQMLRSRKRVVPTGQTQAEEEKWITAYQIIFPDDADIPSPYYTNYDITSDTSSNTIEEYSRYLRKELPPLIRRELESLMEGEIEERLQTKIIQTMQGLQSRLHHEFRQTCLAPQEAENSTEPEHPTAEMSSKAAGKMPDTAVEDYSHPPGGNGEDTLFQLDEFLLGPSMNLGYSADFMAGLDFGSADSGYWSRGALESTCTSNSGGIHGFQWDDGDGAADGGGDEPFAQRGSSSS